MFGERERDGGRECVCEVLSPPAAQSKAKACLPTSEADKLHPVRFAKGEGFY